MKKFDNLKHQARELRKQGFSMAQIGRKLGFQSGTIFRWVKDIEFDGHNEESMREQRQSHCRDDLRKQAQELRSQGYSYKMIMEQINVSKSTLSLWLRDVPMQTRTLIQSREAAGRQKSAHTLRELYKAKRAKVERDAETFFNNLLEGPLSRRELFLMGLTLYWGEGSKRNTYPALGNSDPDALKLFIHWMQECFDILPEQFRCHLCLYPDTDISESEAYWSEVLGIPPSQFHKSTVDYREDKNLTKRGMLRYGTAHIKVLGKGSTYLLYQILYLLKLLKQHIF